MKLMFDEKDNELAMVECKFHSAENKSNVKVPLYVFRDLMI
jgi:hypothetical protein